MALQANLVEIDPVIGRLDIGVGEMLIAVAQVEGPPRAEAVAYPQMTSELK
jgi:hypothetical protein